MSLEVPTVSNYKRIHVADIPKKEVAIIESGPDLSRWFSLERSKNKVNLPRQSKGSLLPVVCHVDLTQRRSSGIGEIECGVVPIQVVQNSTSAKPNGTRTRFKDNKSAGRVSSRVYLKRQ